MQLYNTLTRTKEEFRPQDDPITIYVCGVTPYDDAHLGHAMSIIIFDTLRRYLEWRGHSIRFAYNFTDIDDKMIARASRLGIPVAELASRQIEQFQNEWNELNVRPADIHPRATEEILKMIEVIEGLISSGMAYAAGGDVYYRVNKQPNYGKLSHRNLEEMIAGSRVELNSQKEHPMDFVLWKSAKPEEPSWNSPWGKGRPGWHIECSAMSIRYLGEQIDLHGGGMDLIFPHHENEIAQSEAFTGKVPFVRHWMHNAMMQLGDEKMSKSLGNIISLRDGLQQYGSDAIRLFILSSQYRSPLTYSEDALIAASRGSERLRSAAMIINGEENGHLNCQEARDHFIEAMEDDLGTAQAIAILFNLAKEINRERSKGNPASGGAALLRELGGVLGLTFHTDEHLRTTEPLVELLINVRETLRTKQEYVLGDKIRDDLADMGITLEDGEKGTTWRFTPQTIKNDSVENDTANDSSLDTIKF